MGKLREVIDKIINEKPLPLERCNHLLLGKWEGALECHVEPDWLLIYDIDKTVNEVTFHRSGTHSDLF
jgi:mRNA interferase YafQ